MGEGQQLVLGGVPRPMSMNAVLLEAAGVHKTRGGNAYRDGRTTAALEAYRKGIRHLRNVRAAGGTEGESEPCE